MKKNKKYWVPTFLRSNHSITDQILLKYTDAGNCVAIEHFRFDYIGKYWVLIKEWHVEPDKESSTDVRSTGIPGPVVDEVQEWIATL